MTTLRPPPSEAHTMPAHLWREQAGPYAALDYTWVSSNFRTLRPSAHLYILQLRRNVLLIEQAARERAQHPPPRDAASSNHPSRSAGHSRPSDGHAGPDPPPHDNAGPSRPVAENPGPSRPLSGSAGPGRSLRQPHVPQRPLVPPQDEPPMGRLIPPDEDMLSRSSWESHSAGGPSTHPPPSTDSNRREQPRYLPPAAGSDARYYNNPDRVSSYSGGHVTGVHPAQPFAATYPDGSTSSLSTPQYGPAFPYAPPRSDATAPPPEPFVHSDYAAIHERALQSLAAIPPPPDAAPHAPSGYVYTVSAPNSVLHRPLNRLRNPCVRRIASCCYILFYRPQCSPWDLPPLLAWCRPGVSPRTPTRPHLA